LLAVSRETLPHLIKTEGSVIDRSSTVSKGVIASTSVYSSSKAAVDHITRILAAEYGPDGVRINAVAPGLVATDMSAGVRSNDQMLAMMVEQTPMGRIGEPSDIANAVLLLAGDEAGWITGQVVQASGGMWL